MLSPFVLTTGNEVRFAARLLIIEAAISLVELETQT